MSVRHIIYCTHDDRCGRFYIGKHSTANANDSYLGSGRWITACKTGRIPLRRFNVFECSDENTAYAMEFKLVSEAKKQYGDLCMNLTDGGRGQSKGNLAGERHPLWGKPVSQETRAKQSAAKRGRKLSQKHKENLKKAMESVFTPEVRKKIGDASRGRKKSERFMQLMSGSNNPVAKKVLCVETGTVYGSVVDAAKAIGCAAGSISVVARGNPKRKTVFGLHFQYQ